MCPILFLPLLGPLYLPLLVSASPPFAFAYVHTADRMLMCNNRKPCVRRWNRGAITGAISQPEEDWPTERNQERERERERERESWEGEKEEKDEAKGNVVADLEDLIINAYRQDWPIFAGSKGLRPSILISIIVRSSRNATSVDGTLYLMRRYQPTSLSSPDNPPVIPSFSFALSLSLLILL